MDDDRRCTARSKRSGQQCKRLAVDGASVCTMHGGAAPQVQAAARRRVERRQAEVAVVTLGLPREVDPHQALLEELYRTAGHVAWLDAKVAELEEDEVHADSMFGKQLNEWVRLRESERSHLVRVAKACVDVGVEERRVRLAEQQGELLVQVIRGVLADLGVDEGPGVGRVVAKHLRLVAPAG